MEIFKVPRTNLATNPFEERRIAERISMGLPVSISIGSETLSAKLVNISREGAMIELRVPLRPRSCVAVKCGSIRADAVVVWSRDEVIGLSFKRPISELQVREQISRCTALQALRSRGGKS